MRTVEAERVYHATWIPDVQLRSDNGGKPYRISDRSLMAKVCRVTSSGDGQIICSPNCVSFSVCELGKEYMRRPHLWS